MSKETQTKENGAEVKNYKILNQDKKDSVISLEVEVPFEFLKGQRERSIKTLGKEVEVKGFRKGSAPANMIEKEIGEVKILEEMSYQTIISVLPQIIEHEKINALTQPKISVTKLAPDNPLVFKVEFILMPEIVLADYKKIAQSVKNEDEPKVEEKEINEYIDYIRKSKADAEALRKKTSADPKEREEAHKDDGKDKDNKKGDEKKEPALPELDDEFVKTLGDFKNVEDFKKQLRENMLTEKKQKTNQKRRLEILEKIITESKIDLPDLMIEEELQRMVQQFKGDLEQAKMDFEDYLKQIKKTEADLLKEWRPDAIKRTKMNLLLPKIAMEEKLQADPEKVKHEVEHLKKHYPDINDEQAQSYVAHVLRNDEVLKFLEEIK